MSDSESRRKITLSDGTEIDEDDPRYTAIPVELTEALSGLTPTAQAEGVKQYFKGAQERRARGDRSFQDMTIQEAIDELWESGTPQTKLGLLNLRHKIQMEDRRSRHWDDVLDKCAELHAKWGEAGHPMEPEDA